MTDLIRKIFDIDRKTIDAEKGIYEITISTEVVDRDGDIVEAAGVLTDSYVKNPVVLFGHNYYDPGAIVGRTLEIKVEKGKKIKSIFQFADWGTSIGADIVRRLWDQRLLNAASIGFRPMESSPLMDEDWYPDFDSPYVNEFGKRFTSWELLEWSIVTVPANQEALREIAKNLGERFPDTEANYEALMKMFSRPVEGTVETRPDDAEPGIRIGTFDEEKGETVDLTDTVLLGISAEDVRQRMKEIEVELSEEEAEKIVVIMEDVIRLEGFSQEDVMRKVLELVTESKEDNEPAPAELEIESADESEAPATDELTEGEEAELGDALGNLAEAIDELGDSFGRNDDA